MKIGELAKRSGTNAETVRYYERIGILPQPARTDSNYRDYGPGEVERLAFIRHARSLGFDLNDIRSLVDLAEQPERDCEQADLIASRHLEAVEGKIRKLTSLRDELLSMIAACQGGRSVHCKILQALGDHSRCSTEH